MDNDLWRAVRRSTLVLAAVYLGLLVVGQQAQAATPCASLPSSDLQLYYMKPPAVEQRIVPSEDLDSGLQPELVIARHAAMRSASNVAAWIEITHRILQRGKDAFCNAPERVRIGFGSSWQQVRVASGAISDHCVRRELAEHASAHISALSEGVDLFIGDTQSTLLQGLVALKQTPALTEGAAIAQWNEGMGRLIVEAKKQLRVFLRKKSEEVDRPATLTAFNAACGGRVGLLGLGGI